MMKVYLPYISIVVSGKHITFKYGIFFGRLIDNMPGFRGGQKHYYQVDFKKP
jgi:hypothetical protein